MEIDPVYAFVELDDYTSYYYHRFTGEIIDNVSADIIGCSHHAQKFDKFKNIEYINGSFVVTVEKRLRDLQFTVTYNRNNKMFNIIAFDPSRVIRAIHARVEFINFFAVEYPQEYVPIECIGCFISDKKIFYDMRHGTMLKPLPYYDSLVSYVRDKTIDIKDILDIYLIKKNNTFMVKLCDGTNNTHFVDVVYNPLTKIFECEKIDPTIIIYTILTDSRFTEYFNSLIPAHLQSTIEKCDELRSNLRCVLVDGEKVVYSVYTGHTFTRDDIPLSNCSYKDFESVYRCVRRDDTFELNIKEKDNIYGTARARLLINNIITVEGEYNPAKITKYIRDTFLSTYAVPRNSIGTYPPLYTSPNTVPNSVSNTTTYYTGAFIFAATGPDNVTFYYDARTGEKVTTPSDKPPKKFEAVDRIISAIRNDHNFILELESNGKKDTITVIYNPVTDIFDVPKYDPIFIIMYILFEDKFRPHFIQHRHLSFRDQLVVENKTNLDYDLKANEEFERKLLSGTRYSSPVASETDCIYDADAQYMNGINMLQRVQEPDSDSEGDTRVLYAYKNFWMKKYKLQEFDPEILKNKLPEEDHQIIQDIIDNDASNEKHSTIEGVVQNIHRIREPHKTEKKFLGTVEDNVASSYWYPRYHAGNIIDTYGMRSPIIPTINTYLQQIYNNNDKLEDIIGDTKPLPIPERENNLEEIPFVFNKDLVKESKVEEIKQKDQGQIESVDETIDIFARNEEIIRDIVETDDNSLFITNILKICKELGLTPREFTERCSVYVEGESIYVSLVKNKANIKKQFKDILDSLKEYKNKPIDPLMFKLYKPKLLWLSSAASIPALEIGLKSLAVNCNISYTNLLRYLMVSEVSVASEAVIRQNLKNIISCIEAAEPRMAYTHMGNPFWNMD